MRIIVMTQISAMKPTIIARIARFFFFFCLCKSVCGMFAPYKIMRAKKRANR